MTNQQLVDRNLKLAQDRDLAIMRMEQWCRASRKRQRELLPKPTTETIVFSDRYHLAAIGIDPKDPYWQDAIQLAP